MGFTGFTTFKLAVDQNRNDKTLQSVAYGSQNFHMVPISRRQEIIEALTKATQSENWFEKIMKDS